MTIETWLAETRAVVDGALKQRLALPKLSAADDPANALADAMRYATLGPGKRLRPILTVASALAVGGTRDDAIPAACAVELLHAYTLVHDDLPAMDDDHERRGRPTVHVAFGEAIAVLAGDALLTAAFAAIADVPRDVSAAVRVLAERAGANQLLAGQARDLSAAADIDFETLEALHAGKTGALYSAAAELGGISGGASAEQRETLARFGMAVGISFQHADDKDDGEHFQHRTVAHARATELAQEARQLASALPNGARLLELVPWIAERH